MHESELTQAFCVPCHRALELRTDGGDRYYQCPGCGSRVGQTALGGTVTAA